MHQPVVIENDALRLQVWPGLGGKVSSIIDKADHHELLFNYPVELPTEPLYDQPFDQSWHAGWDECFPAVAASRYPGHPYDTIPVPDHGELWGLPATAVPTKAGITTVWHGLRFGYRLTRKLHLQDNALLAEYTLVNLAPFDFRFVWAPHALLALQPGIQLELGGNHEFRYSHDASEERYHQPFAWPTLSAEENFAEPDALPARRGWKLYSAEPIAAPVLVRYPQRKRSVAISYDRGDDGPNAYWGVWINTGGWGGHRHLAVMPTFGRYDRLDLAVGDQSAGSVGPMGRCEWSVSWLAGTI